MATLSELENESSIIRYDPQLSPNKCEERYIFFSPKAMKFVEDSLPAKKPFWGDKKIRPIEQLFDLLGGFCGGERMNYGPDFKVLDPRSDGKNYGIWELKTPDLRVFGWFFQKDIFIVSEVVLADFLKKMNNYNRHVEFAVQYRDKLELDPPKYLQTMEYADVISNQN